MSLVNELVSPLNWAQFSNEILFKKPYAKPQVGKAMRGLLNWDLLNEIFLSGHHDCWLAQNGQLSLGPDLSGKLDLNKAFEYFLKGHTVLVRHAEKAHPSLTKIAKDFVDRFQKPTDIQLYCTPQDAEGFDWHYDIEDVFVIQSRGEKEFRLLTNTVSPRPLRGMKEDRILFSQETKEFEIRCHLKPGDWLYIPAGYWHKARAITDSFHLSIGVLFSSL